MTKALITGITGQDGSYLAEFLLAKGYEVYGLVRRSSSFNRGRIEHIREDERSEGTRFRLVYGDLNDASSLNHILRTFQPNEIYNLGAQSHVRVSFDIPEYTAEVTGVGCLRILEAIRESGSIVSFTRRHPRNFTAKSLRHLRKKPPHFIPAAPTPVPKPLPSIRP